MSYHKQPIKVLHVGKFYSPFNGGIENFLKELVEFYEKSGQVKNIILAHHDIKYKKTSDNEIDNVKVIKVRSFGRFIYAPISPSFLWHLKKVIDKNKPDIIHIHLPNLSAFWCLFSKEARNIPWVIHWHSDVIGTEPDKLLNYAYKFYRIFEKQLLERAKIILVTSKNYLNASVALKPYKKKCEIVPLGISSSQTNFSRPHDAQGTTMQHHLRVLMVGRLTKYKGHKVILEAIAKTEGVKLYVIGKGELEKNLNELTLKLKIENRVFWLKGVSNDELYYQIAKADLVCLPSIDKTEAFGVILLEAARAGKPVLISNIKESGMTCVVEDGKTGLFAEKGNSDSFAEKLEWAKSNKNLLQIMGRNAKDKFERNYTIQKVAQSIFTTYQKIYKGYFL